MTAPAFGRPLALRVRHKDGEGAYSLALRLAHRFGYSRLAPFATKMGLFLNPGLGSAHLDLERLSALSGVPLARLTNWTLTRQDPDVLYNSLAVPRRLIRQRPRICPACLAEDSECAESGERPEDARYLREHWRFVFVQGCERHGLELLSRCSACEEQLDRMRCPFWRCRCGADLAQAASRRLDAEEMDFLRWCLGRLGVSARSSTSLAVLNAVGIGPAVDLLRCLGLSATGGRDRARVASTPPVEGLSAILVAGAQALSDLPNSFERLLDSIAVIDDERKFGPSGIYGKSFVTWMRRHEALRELLLPVFEVHASKRGRFVRYEDAIRDIPPQTMRRDRRNEALTAEEAARLKTLVLWPSAERPRRSEVVAALKPVGKLLVGHMAAKHLQLNRKTFDALVRTGLIVPAWSPYRGCATYFYTAYLDSWLEHLLRGARTVLTRTADHLSIEEATHVFLLPTQALIRRLLIAEPGNVARLRSGKGVKAILLKRTWLASLPRCDYPPAGSEAHSARPVHVLNAPHLSGTENTESRYISQEELARLTSLSVAALRARIAALKVAPAVAGDEPLYYRTLTLAALAA